jgi:predicted metal-dependent phosphoesterase TrpH
MPSTADLHLHSTISDGRLTPTQLLELAQRNGVRIMSLTDHDIVDGLPQAFEAASRFPGFTLIPGIEMSTDVPGNEVHILGHFIDWQRQDFRDRLNALQESRLGRARKMVDRLRELGMPIEWDNVQPTPRAPSDGPTAPWPSSTPAIARPSTMPSISSSAATAPPT